MMKILYFPFWQIILIIPCIVLIKSQSDTEIVFTDLTSNSETTRETANEESTKAYEASTGLITHEWTSSITSVEQTTSVLNTSEISTTELSTQDLISNDSSTESSVSFIDTTIESSTPIKPEILTESSNNIETTLDEKQTTVFVTQDSTDKSTEDTTFIVTATPELSSTYSSVEHTTATSTTVETTTTTTTIFETTETLSTSQSSIEDSTSGYSSTEYTTALSTTVDTTIETTEATTEPLCTDEDSTSGESKTEATEPPVASDEEIIARTICREAFEKGEAAYDAVAWVIYNRIKSKSFPNTGKEVCLQNGQFAVWRHYWCKKDIPLNPKTTGHKDYPYCLKLAKAINDGKPPTPSDPTKGALFFLTDSETAQTNHPGGLTIGGNYFFYEW